MSTASPVAGADGRAGMAAVVAGGRLRSRRAPRAHVHERLSPLRPADLRPAQPRASTRRRPSSSASSTWCREGFDPEKIRRPDLFRRPERRRLRAGGRGPLRPHPGRHDQALAADPPPRSGEGTAEGGGGATQAVESPAAPSTCAHRPPPRRFATWEDSAALLGVSLAYRPAASAAPARGNPRRITLPLVVSGISSTKAISRGYSAADSRSRTKRSDLGGERVGRREARLQHDDRP